MLIAPYRSLFLEQQHSLMLYAEGGLQCTLIKTVTSVTRQVAELGAVE